MHCNYGLILIRSHGQIVAIFPLAITGPVAFPPGAPPCGSGVIANVPPAPINSRISAGTTIDVADFASTIPNDLAFPSAGMIHSSG